MKSKTYTFRADEELSKTLEEIMEKNSLNKSEAIRYLADFYKNPDNNSDLNFKRNVLICIMNMQTVLNEYSIAVDVEKGRKILEGLKCLIL